MEGPDSPRISVLHVDDEPGVAETAAEFLRHESDGFSVETAASASEGLDRLAAAAFDCVVSDYDMPKMNGIEFLETVRATYPDLPFVLFTGKGSEEIASEAVSVGVSDYLQKRGGTERYTLLANRIENLVAQHRAEEGLQTRIRQQAAVADLGQYALRGCDLDALFARAVESVRRDSILSTARCWSTGQRTMTCCCEPAGAGGRGWSARRLSGPARSPRPATRYRRRNRSSSRTSVRSRGSAGRRCCWTTVS
jgi:DNA-binding NarL/FixJ family response regulator